MDMQPDSIPVNHRTHIGRSRVEYRQARSILTKATGFIDAFDYTLNPYSGCTFGCNYCYAAFFANRKSLQDEWGQWLDVKANALELLKRRRKRPINGKSIYISSVTDPYQPIEKELGLTRAILEELLEHHHVFPVIQTRGPLVTRDIDVLGKFEHVQVNMTITTDDEAIRRAFEPTCPSTTQRLNAIQEVHEAGIRSVITMTPLLPVADPVAFANQLKKTGIEHFVAQFFHPTKARFVAGTGAVAQKLSNDFGWDETRYEEIKAIFQLKLPTLYEGKPGFMPYWLRT